MLGAPIAHAMACRQIEREIAFEKNRRKWIEFVEEEGKPVEYEMVEDLRGRPVPRHRILRLKQEDFSELEKLWEKESSETNAEKIFCSQWLLVVTLATGAFIGFTIPNKGIPMAFSILSMIMLAFIPCILIVGSARSYGCFKRDKVRKSSRKEKEEIYSKYGTSFEILTSTTHIILPEGKGLESQL